MNMRPVIEPPSELAQLRAQIGIQAMAIEALVRRVAAMEVTLADMQRQTAPAGSVTLPDDPARPSMAAIAAMVESKTAITVEDLRGSNRSKPFTLARSLFCACAHRAGYSSVQIGRWLGGRDHSTILHLCQREPAALVYFAEMRAALDEVAQHVAGQGAGQDGREVAA